MRTQHKPTDENLTQIILDEASTESTADADTDTGKTKKCSDLKIIGITPREFAAAHP